MPAKHRRSQEAIQSLEILHGHGEKRDVKERKIPAIPDRKDRSQAREMAPSRQRTHKDPQRYPPNQSLVLITAPY
jgi:hypothetical protein